MSHHSPRVFALAMLNSSLDEEEIIPYLDALKVAGYEGICLHPRDGLRVPYDSRLFWEKMDHIFHLCCERDLEIWHYDEFPFPSGIAGGLLPVDDPTSIVRGLRFEEISIAPNRDGLIEIGAEALLVLLRYRENEDGEKFDIRDVTADCGAIFDTWTWREHHNLAYTGALNVHEELHERGFAHRFMRAFASPQPLADGEKLLAVKIVPAPGRADLPGRPDLTRPEITNRFLNRIYTRLSELSEKHGLQNTPVFQDEVTFGTTHPWNEEIAARLKNVWGEELPVKLAALHKPNGEGWEQTRLEYRNACQDAFEQNWFVRVRDFCHANNLQMTGHLAGEESIYGHCQLLGNAFKNLRHFDIPGYDIISSTISNDINRSQQTGIKVVQSTAWLEGRKPTMVETFGANGIHSDLQRQRNVLAWLGAHDFTTVFDHSAYHSAHSIRKYEAPPVSTRFNPLAVGRPDLWNWHNWFADLMREYAFHPRTLILFPVESLARYSMTEIELWREEVSLMETWFHYAFAASLDAIFLPSHFLDDVEACEDGFHLQGHVFENFVVPPLVSLHEELWDKLLRFCDHPGFAWCAPRDGSITVFGEKNGSNPQPIPAVRIFPCDETELLEKKARFFDKIFDSPLRTVESDVTLLKTTRRNLQGDEILVLINTHDTAIEVRATQPLGAIILQPPNDFAGTEYCDGKIRMQPREVLVFHSSPGATEVLPTQISECEEILPLQSRLRFCAPNFVGHRGGILRLEGHEEKAFLPAPVGAIWNLENGVLPQPLKLEAEFPITLSKPLTELSILIDDESISSETVVKWDGQTLTPHHAEILDQNNTVFPIPTELLNAAAHQLSFESMVRNSSEGILERPIYFGSFLVDTKGTLYPMPQESRDWRGEGWSQLGMHGFGPHAYEFVFELNTEQSEQQWDLELPPCIGVAEISINEESLGRSSWEPRILHARGLHPGDNSVRVRLHGSWNNLFSNLNQLENGLMGPIKLRARR